MSENLRAELAVRAAANVAADECMHEWTRTNGSCVDCTEKAIAAAEERGRRRVFADPEALARRFHETYERLAPEYGYETRKESAVPWKRVPEKNRRLMIAVCAALAPRDSAPGLVVCDHCPEFPHSLNDDGTECKHPRAPRDSGKEP